MSLFADKIDLYGNRKEKVSSVEPQKAVVEPVPNLKVRNPLVEFLIMTKFTVLAYV